MGPPEASRLPIACVLGDLDLVRPVGMAGIPVATVGVPGATPRFSRFTAHRVTWHGDLGRPEDLVAALDAFALRCAEPPVLMFQNDAEVLAASRFRDRLATSMRLPLADAELVEDLIDKRRFDALATRTGLPVPRTQIVDTDAAPAPDLRYPLIVKPVSRGDGAWSALAADGIDGKALRVDSGDDLAAVWPLLARSVPSVLLQEYIPGEEDRIESYHVYVDTAGEIAGEFTGRKIRTWPRAHGFTTSLEVGWTDDVARIGREIVRTLDLRGVAKVDLKRGPDGVLALLEINPRFNLWHYPGAVAGVNLPALAWADLTGRPRPPAGPVRSGVRWCNAIDATAAGERGIPVTRWLPWALRCSARAHLTPDDPGAIVGRALWRLAHRARGHG